MPHSAKPPDDLSTGRIRVGMKSIPRVAPIVLALTIVLRGGVLTKDKMPMIAAPVNHTMFARPKRLQLSARAAGIIAIKKEAPRMQLLAAFLSPALVTLGWTIFAGTVRPSVIAPMSTWCAYYILSGKESQYISDQRTDYSILHLLVATRTPQHSSIIGKILIP